MAASSVHIDYVAGHYTCNDADKAGITNPSNRFRTLYVVDTAVWYEWSGSAWVAKKNLAVPA